MLGAWVPWWALAGTAAVVTPAASFLFVVPVVGVALGAVAAAVAGRLAGNRGADVRPAAFIGLAVAAIVLLPMEPAFVDALGFQFGWLNGFRAALLGATLVPLVVATRNHVAARAIH
ncbi:MAG: hypothetical protein WCO75_08600 [Planctomycetota bacterium]